MRQRRPTGSAMTITTIDVPTLKAVKNSVIGNRTAKGSYGRDEVFISRCAYPYRDVHVPTKLFVDSWNALPTHLLL